MPDVQAEAPVQTPTPTPNPAFQAPPTGAPGGPAIPPTIPVTIAEYQRLTGLEKQLNEFQVAKAKELETKEGERLKALAEQGKAEQALEEQKKSWESKVASEVTRYTQLEQSLFAKEKEAVLAGSLAGRTFAGDTPEDQAETAKQLREHLESRFETSRSATGELVVREKSSGRPAADVLKEVLTSSRFNHFFAATSRGGSGTDGTRSAATQANQFNSEHVPGSVGWHADRLKAEQKMSGAIGFGPAGR